jgi:hypothetical protein
VPTSLSHYHLLFSLIFYFQSDFESKFEKLFSLKFLSGGHHSPNTPINHAWPPRYNFIFIITQRTLRSRRTSLICVLRSKVLQEYLSCGCGLSYFSKIKMISDLFPFMEMALNQLEHIPPTLFSPLISLSHSSFSSLQCTLWKPLFERTQRDPVPRFL